MNITINTPSKTERELVIEVPGEDVIREIGKESERIRKQKQIPGFRQGKAPLELINLQYGKQIEATAVDTVMKNAYRDAIKEHRLHPVNTAEISDIQYKPGLPLIFTARFEVVPDFSLGDLNGMQAEREEREVTSEMIEFELKDIQYHFGTLRTKEKPAEIGDRITFDITEIDPATGVSLIGRAFTNDVLRLGEQYYGSEFDEQLIGVKTGETRRVSRQLEQYVIANPQQQGTQSPTEENYLVTVKKVEAVDLPEIDENLAKEMNYDSVEALHNGVKERLQNQLHKAAQKKFSENLEKEAVRIVNPSVPQSLVERYLDGFEKDYKKMSKTPVDSRKLREENKDYAREQVQWYLVREKIIETQQFTVTDQEIDDYLKDYAQKNLLDAERIRLQYRSDDRRKELKEKLMDNKIYEFLESKADVIVLKR